MKQIDEVNLTFRIIEYGIDRPFFTFNELQKSLNLDMNEIHFVRNVLWAMDSKGMNPNSIFCIVNPKYNYINAGEVNWSYDDPCMILPNAIFSYVDHLEIIEARKTAKESKKLSWIAIWISGCIGLFSLLVGLLQLYFQIK